MVIMEKKKLRILICEDEGLTVLRLQKELDSLGYTVVGEAKDGLEAVKLAKELCPDVILMDIKMPKLDGIAATTEIMATQPTAIIMLTAYSQEDFVEKVIVAGASAYLLKPVNSGQLLPTIELAAHKFAEFQGIRNEAENLKEALEVRKLIERAKGILMQRSNLSEPEAFKKMQRISQNSRKPMKEIAQEILRADEIFGAPKC
jgi:response regulator NasT